MPFDGTGNYSPPSPPTFPAVNGEVIRSDYFNAIITDIANSLTLTFTKDGQSAPTAELDFNNQNLTNIDALDATSVDALNYFINGDLLDYTTFSQDFISSPDANTARAKLGLSAGTDSGLVSGGQVVWETGYQFRISAAVYLINGIQYSSAEQTVTLTAADGALDRIDVIYLDTAGLAGAIAGTAAALPTEPDITFGTQIKLTFVFVQAASSAPAEVVNTDIYLENVEWTSSTSGTGFNPASTNNPYSGTTCIEGTSVANNAYVQLQAGAPITLDSATNLSMFLRSKATWASGRVLRVQWYLNGVAKGVALTIASGYWGFNSSTLAYQLVAIPIAQFVLPTGTSVNQLRISDSGGAIGFYLDNIILQAQGTDLDQNTEDYLTQGEADARYLQLVNVGALTASGYTMATDRILGRDTAGTGAVEELSLGGGLSIASGQLSVSSTGGTLSGTSFPVSPTAGDIFRRTDLNFEYIYDGTRWLTTQLFTVTTSSMVASVGISADSNPQFNLPLLPLYDAWLESWDTSTFRNAAGEWDIELYTVDSVSIAALLDTQDGSADVTGTIYNRNRALGILVTSATKALRVLFNEISGTSAGVFTASIHYRLVGP